jgi:Peptidase M50B-like
VVTGLEDAVGAALDAVVGAARDRPAVLVAGLLALLAVGWTTSWRLMRGVVTIAHEGGHALVAVLTGRGLAGIRLHADSSGVTASTGRAGGLGLVLTFLGGYPAPAALGLVAAALVAHGRPAEALWLVVVLLVGTLTQVRNAFGVGSVLATGAMVGAVAWWGDAALQAGFAAALAWFLLFGGLRSVRELQRGRRRAVGRGLGPSRSAGESDADALARLTGVPGGMWTGLFWLAGSTAVVMGGWVLVGPT